MLYLIFNEGYTTASGTALAEDDLTTEAMRPADCIELAPEDGEVAGLLALMLLTRLARAARVGTAGAWYR